MELFSRYSDPQTYGELGSPVSDAGSSRPTSSSDGDAAAAAATTTLKLASSCPKKRAGRKKFRETRHPVYRGVRMRNSGKWVCEVREPNSKSRIWLGTFPTADMAARAHDVAAITLRGRSACLNFADSAWRLPMPASSSAKDIQEAAAKAAEISRPSENSPGAAAEEEEEEEEEKEKEEEVGYMDEEAVFGMPGLLANMAEGMLLPPLEYRWSDDDNVEVGADMSLWSHNI